MTGMVGNQWELSNFSPMGTIPTATKLTSYSGGPREFMQTPLQEFIDMIESGQLQIPLGPVFQLREIARAHEAMDSNAGKGKIVVLTPQAES